MKAIFRLSFAQKHTNGKMNATLRRLNYTVYIYIVRAAVSIFRLQAENRQLYTREHNVHIHTYTLQTMHVTTWMHFVIIVK